VIGQLLAARTTTPYNPSQTPACADVTNACRMRINVQSTSGGDSQIGDGLGVMSELGFLLINAVAIAIATYLASFRSLNVG